MYNTTHHVLKRIAVPNEAMLTEVKKEVDIMVCLTMLFMHVSFLRHRERVM